MGLKKYETWLKEDNLIRLKGWARSGLTDEQIAHNMGIDPATLSGWKKKYDKINQALKKQKEVVDYEVESTLLKNAMGYEYTEKKETIEKDELGKDRKRIEIFHKWMPPNTTAQIFWLKNRKPKQWRDKPEDFNEKAQDSIKILAEVIRESRKDAT